MPKLPILRRTRFFERLSDGTFRDLDWQLVDTTLGSMLEPRTLIMDTAALQALDVYDSGVTERVLNPGGALFTLTSGEQWPKSLNTL